MDWIKVWEKENDRSYIKFQKSLAKTIEKLIIKRNCKNVVDIGCGPAFVIHFLSQKYPKINFIGFDPYKPIIKKDRKFSSKNLSFFVANIDNLPDKKYNLITSLGVLHYSKNPLKHIDILMSHLNKNGALFCNYPNKTLLYSMRKKKSVDRKRFEFMFKKVNLITTKDIKKKYSCKLVRETKKGNKFVLIEPK